jgi:hypothetical protein
MALTPSYRSFTVHPLTGTFAMLPLIDMVNHSATSFNAKVTPYDEDRMALDGGKAQARSKAHQDEGGGVILHFPARLYVGNPYGIALQESAE